MKTDDMGKWIKRDDIASKTTLRFCDGRLAEPVPEKKGLARLFEQLTEGETPNFLQMMAAISDVSELYPESEQCSDPTLCLTCG